MLTSTRIWLWCSQKASRVDRFYLGTETMTEGLDVQIKDDVAEVTINRPPVNALARSTFRQITQVFNAFVDKPEVRAIILTGQGSRAFCAGRDIKDLEQERNEPTSRNVGDPYRTTREAIFSVRECAIPVICAVNGPAVGAGVALAAVSDVVVAAENATFALTEIDVGVLGAASFAQRLVGSSKTRRMFFTGKRISASEVYRLGGLESVVPADQLMDEARSLASEIASKNPVAVRLAKAFFVRTEAPPLEMAC
jgi:enoyl-CoA hydratase